MAFEYSNNVKEKIMRVRKDFLMKAVLMSLLGSTVFLLAFERGYSAMGYRYLKQRDYEKAINAFSLANNKSGLGLLFLKRRMYKLSEEKFRQIGDKKGLGLSTCRKESSAKQ